MPDALIWGASGGIGRALVTLLKSNGWRVFAAARSTNRVPTEADLICEFDATSIYSMKETAMRVAVESGEVDLVIYAVGEMHAETLDTVAPDVWTRVVTVNLHGAQMALQVSLPLVRPGGHVMVLGAHIDRLMLPRFGAYAAAKAGLEPLLTILQKENRKLKFTLVRPGAVDTPFWEQVPFSLPKNAVSPQWVAEAMLARYETGEQGVLDL